MAKGRRRRYTLDRLGLPRGRGGVMPRRIMARGASRLLVYSGAALTGERTVRRQVGADLGFEAVVVFGSLLDLFKGVLGTGPGVINVQQSGPDQRF